MAKIDQKKLSAVIIKGNPERITKNTYKGIYEDVKKILEEMNIDVFFNEGRPHTTPPAADIWIGHSRGVDRLQYASKDILTIKLGSYDTDALNHPDEIVSSDPQNFDKLSDEQKSKHLTLHPSVALEIRKKIQKRFKNENTFS